MAAVQTEIVSGAKLPQPRFLAHQPFEIVAFSKVSPVHAGIDLASKPLIRTDNSRLHPSQTQNVPHRELSHHLTEKPCAARVSKIRTKFPKSGGFEKKPPTNAISGCFMRLE